MKVTKKFLSILLVMIMILSLAGCSSDKANTANGTKGDGAAKEETDSSKTAGTTGGEKTKVVIWSKDRHDADLITKKVEAYNASNTDNIVVDYQIYTENYEQAIDMAFQSGEAPDILVQQSQVFQKYLSSGKWADYNQFMDEDFKKTFSSVIIPGMNEFDGKVNYIPTTGTTGRLFYNKNIFEKAGIANPPATLEEMVEDAKIITQKLSGEGIYGFAANMKSPASALGRSILYEAQRQLGIDAGYNFSTGKYDFTGYGPIITAWKELMSSNVAFPGCESLDIDPLRTQFAAGKIGMYISFTHAEPGVYANQFPMTDKWGVAQIPVSGGKVAGAQGYIANSGYLFNADSKNLEAAWKAYRAIFTSTDYLAEYYENGLGISIIPDVIAKAKPAQVYVDNKDLMIGSTDAIWPLTPQESNTSGFVVEGMDMYTTFAAMILGYSDIESGLKDLTDRYNAALKASIDDGSGSEVKIDGFDPMNPSK
ncbi:ABC transporter substrate-binding protein [Anaerocolumna jejuensis]|uniref:ABC transporter substrate-binding protein n=1 Tax=Anaerocolumna jejuensis TaxID=259063 RepID=UPI003F7CCB4A